MDFSPWPGIMTLICINDCKKSDLVVILGDLFFTWVNEDQEFISAF